MTRVTQNRRMGFYCGPSIRVEQEKNVEIFNEKKDTLYYNQNNQIHQFLINLDLREIIQIVVLHFMFESTQILGFLKNFCNSIPNSRLNVRQAVLVRCFFSKRMI